MARIYKNFHGAEKHHQRFQNVWQANDTYQVLMFLLLGCFSLCGHNQSCSQGVDRRLPNGGPPVPDRVKNDVEKCAHVLEEKGGHTGCDFSQHQDGSVSPHVPSLQVTPTRRRTSRTVDLALALTAAGWRVSL